jgi:hypothetical protein
LRGGQMSDKKRGRVDCCPCCGDENVLHDGGAPNAPMPSSRWETGAPAAKGQQSQMKGAA